eukprot:2174419-Amphidinium_carterae.1
MPLAWPYNWWVHKCFLCFSEVGHYVSVKYMNEYQQLASGSMYSEVYSKSLAEEHREASFHNRQRRPQFFSVIR